MRATNFQEWTELALGEPEQGAQLQHVDRSQIGIGFIDLLFALVVGFIFSTFINADEALIDFDGMTWADGSHVAVAAILTLTSWLGYHASLNSPKFTIHFANLPLAIFVLDILMVVLYALAVASRNAFPDSPALAEALAVFVGFVLYATWDEVNRRMKPPWNDAFTRALRDSYESDPHRFLAMSDIRNRRMVTLWMLIPSAILLLLAAVLPSNTATVVAIDLNLIIVLVAFRDLKEHAFETQDEANLRSDVASLQRLIVDKRDGSTPTPTTDEIEAKLVSGREDVRPRRVGDIRSHIIGWSTAFLVTCTIIGFAATC